MHSSIAEAYCFSGRRPLACLLQLDDSFGLLMPAQVVAQLVFGQQLLASKPQSGSGRIQLIAGMLHTAHATVLVQPGLCQNWLLSGPGPFR